MIALIRIVLVFSILHDSLVIGDETKSPSFIVVGAGASGIATATKLLENGYNNVMILEAENRIGGRVHSIPFGKGFVDMGAQWCQGERGNVVYELVKNHFQFGDTAIRSNNSYCLTSDGNEVDHQKCVKVLDLSEAISNDLENMAQFNESLGEFFEINYRKRLQNEAFQDVDEELANQISDLSEKETNTLYASETWFELSSKLNAVPFAEGNQMLTWKEHGYKILFDFLMKKLPDPSKALPMDDKIHLNKEVTNIDWTSDEVIVKCADGSEYRADHVIVTVSLGFLKKHHLTLFTPQLPDNKINAIEHTGFGTLGKIFLEFEEPFWPTDVDEWAMYLLLWKQEDKDNITGTEKEWLIDIGSVIRVDAQPNLISALIAGKHIGHFEGLSDNQLIDDCLWLLEKFLGKTLPRPINMRRNKWKSSKYFLGTYSYLSMETQAHNVTVNDLAESIHAKNGRPIVLVAGEATDENFSGYVNGAVASGWRVANEILNYYKSVQH